MSHTIYVDSPSRDAAKTQRSIVPRIGTECGVGLNYAIPITVVSPLLDGPDPIRLKKVDAVN